MSAITPNDNYTNDLNGQSFGNHSIDEEIVEENSNGKANNKVKPQKTKGKDNENKRRRISSEIFGWIITC